MRDLAEALGVLFIVFGVGIIYLPAALILAGLVLVWAANFWTRATDATAHGDDSPGPPKRQ